MKKLTWCCLGTAIVVFVLGAVCLGGAWLVHYELVEYVDHSVDKEIVVDSFKAPGYKTWVTNFDSSQPPLIQAFSFFNITNLYDVEHNGALPIVHEMGPYVYQQKRLNIDVDFTHNGELVSYNTWTRYEFLPDQSQGKESDVIYNINPAYLAALSFAGGELQLAVGSTGPSLKLFFDFLWGPFTQDFVQQAVPDVLSDARIQLVAKAGSEEAFFDTWANATKAPSSAWAGMLVSANSTHASGITLASAQALFNASVPNSLVAWDRNSTTAWRQALYGAPGNSAANALQQQFSLTNPQIQMLLQWLNASFVPTLVVPNITVLWNVTSLSDLAYMQWGEASLSGRVSVTQLYPGLPFPPTPELATFWSKAYPFNTLDWQTSKLLLAGPLGLFETPNVATFFAVLESFDRASIQQNWGLDLGDLATFLPYFAYMAEEWGTPVLKSKLAAGGGLFTNRTVSEWLWYVNDPLLGYILPAASNTAIVGNETTPEAARARHGPSIAKTGKHNLNEIGYYLQWQGHTSIDWMYAYNVPVTGTNNQGQFQPYLTRETILTTWDANYIRLITLLPTDYVHYKGIKMLRYLLSNDTWGINDDYFQSIVGFANMTGDHNGSTVFISNPHMYGADTKYSSMIQGMVQNPATDITVIDIEPITGAVTHYYEALQVNVYLDPANRGHFNLFTSNKLREDVFYPIMWVKEYATLTDKQASEIKDYLYTGISLETIMFWVCIGLGVFLLVFTAPLAALFVWRWRKETLEDVHAYAPININADRLTDTDD